MSLKDSQDTGALVEHHRISRRDKRWWIALACVVVGSFAVLLVWVYYSAQIFLLGAEFTWVYSHRNDPPPDAAPVPARSDTSQPTAEAAATA